jgi:hypothetical protein
MHAGTSLKLLLYGNKVSVVTNGWNIADDVREVMWHILVRSILCCRAGEEMDEIQSSEGVENGQGTFMA